MGALNASFFITLRRPHIDEGIADVRREDVGDEKNRCLNFNIGGRIRGYGFNSLVKLVQCIRLFGGFQYTQVGIESKCGEWFFNAISLTNRILSVDEYGCIGDGDFRWRDNEVIYILFNNSISLKLRR